MHIIKLPSVLPGDLDLADVNKQLRQHSIQLDWSVVASANSTQLAILLEGVDLEADIDCLISGDIDENIAIDIVNYIKSQNQKKKKSPSQKKGKSLEAQFIPTEDGVKIEDNFIPIDSNIPENEQQEGEKESTVKTILQPPMVIKSAKSWKRQCY